MVAATVPPTATPAPLTPAPTATPRTYTDRPGEAPAAVPDSDGPDATREKLRKLLREKAIMRLKYENKDKAPELSLPGHRFYNDPEGFAEDLFAYYLCFKCKKPYYGGERACGGGGVGGPASWNRRHRVSAASARLARSGLIDARCFISL